jgi:hypothetical protein
MAHPQPNKPNPNQLLSIKLVSCVPARVMGLSASERIAVLTVRNGTTHLQPMAICMPDARSIVSALIYMLICHGDEYGLALARAVRSDAMEDDSYMPTITPLPGVAPFEAPSVPRSARSKKPGMRPSRRPDSPRSPFSELEAWRFLQMLRNVKSHEDFMRFVGSEALPLVEKTENSPRNKLQVAPKKRVCLPKSKKPKEK